MAKYNRLCLRELFPVGDGWKRVTFQHQGVFESLQKVPHFAQVSLSRRGDIVVLLVVNIEWLLRLEQNVRLKYIAVKPEVPR